MKSHILSSLIISVLLFQGVLLQAKKLDMVTLEKNNIEIRFVDYVLKLDTTLFYYNGILPFKVQDFIRNDVRPVRVILHNKQENTIVISEKSVEKFQLSKQEILEILQGCPRRPSLFVSLNWLWIAGLMYILEDVYPNPSRMLSTGSLAVGVGTSYLTWRSICTSNESLAEAIQKNILCRRFVVPPNGRIEKIVLVDPSCPYDRCLFDVFNTHDEKVAAFEAVFEEENNHESY